MKEIVAIEILGFPRDSVGRVHLQCRRTRFEPWIGKIPWRRKWQPTPVFLPGKIHGQRSQVGYSPWGLKESDMTEQLNMSIKRRKEFLKVSGSSEKYFLKRKQK